MGAGGGAEGVRSSIHGGLDWIGKFHCKSPSKLKQSPPVSPETAQAEHYFPALLADTFPCSSCKYPLPLLPLLLAPAQHAEQGPPQVEGDLKQQTQLTKTVWGTSRTG